MDMEEFKVKLQVHQHCRQWVEAMLEKKHARQVHSDINRTHIISTMKIKRIHIKKKIPRILIDLRVFWLRKGGEIPGTETHKIIVANSTTNKLDILLYLARANMIHVLRSAAKHPVTVMTKVESKEKLMCIFFLSTLARDRPNLTQFEFHSISWLWRIGKHLPNEEKVNSFTRRVFNCISMGSPSLWRAILATKLVVMASTTMNDYWRFSN